MCANSKLSQQRGSPQLTVPSFVPTTRPYQLLPGIDFDGIKACAAYTYKW
jgi:hypothetical protein